MFSNFIKQKLFKENSGGKRGTVIQLCIIYKQEYMLLLRRHSQLLRDAIDTWVSNSGIPLCAGIIGEVQIFVVKPRFLPRA